MPHRIYLDNAATSWPKRPEALQAAWDFLHQCGATAGRGSYTSSQTADRWLADARKQIASLIGATDSSAIAFCSSGTHALNAALYGLIRPGDHVITTAIEHNSVLRPLAQASRQRPFTLDYAGCDNRGISNIDHAASLLVPQTRWLVVGHASNVTGTVQPLNEWRRLADRAGARLIVDASQTLGYLPIDVKSSRIDVLAAAGHKGLRAMHGCGFLYVVPDLQQELRPLIYGGTGNQSESIDATPVWPLTVEVGNHNLPAIISMAVSAELLVREAQVAPIIWQTAWRDQFSYLVSELKQIPGVRLIGHQAGMPPVLSHVDSIQRVPLVSITLDHWSVHDLATVLDTSYGIEVRSGYHCAALIHQHVGTTQSHGTLRISLGHGTIGDDISSLLTALRQIAQATI